MSREMRGASVGERGGREGESGEKREGREENRGRRERSRGVDGGDEWVRSISKDERVDIGENVKKLVY